MKITKSNRVLKGLFSLKHNVKLYIPSTSNIDRKINNKKYVIAGLKTFGELFGGATSYKAIGSWVSQEKGLVTENVTIIESYATAKQVEKGLASVIEYANTIKRELKQEAVSLEYDNELFFI